MRGFGGLGRLIRRLTESRTAPQSKGEEAELEQDVAGTTFTEMHQYDEPAIRPIIRAQMENCKKDAELDRAVDFRKFTAIVEDKHLQSILQISCQFDKLVKRWLDDTGSRTLADMFDEEAKLSAVKAAVSLAENFLDEGFLGQGAQSVPSVSLTVRQIIDLLTVEFVPNLVTGDIESPSPVIALRKNRPGRVEEETSQTAAEEKKSLGGIKMVNGGNNNKATKRRIVKSSCRFCARSNDEDRASRSGSTDSTDVAHPDSGAEEASEAEDECDDECDCGSPAAKAGKESDNGQ